MLTHNDIDIFILTFKPGFKDGYVGLDDLLGLEIMAVSNGSLPDGNYTKDTGFFFCCRNDSYATAPIVLPKDDAFALFMVNGSNQCQEVRGEVVSKSHLFSICFTFFQPGLCCHKFDQHIATISNLSKI